MAAAGSRESIKVVARFRPLNKTEMSKGSKVCVGAITSESVDIRVCGDAHTHSFTFDRVFDTHSCQREVYEYAAKPIVDSLFQGFNGCLLAYGQTGSGKTHTMMGTHMPTHSAGTTQVAPSGAATPAPTPTPTPTASGDDDGRGIIPRVITDIFDAALRADESCEFTITISFVEIYCERIKDLFAPKNDNLAVGEDPSGRVYVKGAREEYVTTVEEVFEWMRIGNENRAVAATGMNAGSSRSHSLFIVTLAQKNAATGTSSKGKLYLVDLAGSETVSKTGVSGQQLEELKKINKSLSALGNVINALTDGKSTHVPYRDSKLTRVLQECLGGNARTTLITACSPSSWNENETLSTLRFGKRAKRIVNRAIANKERSPDEMRRHISVLEALVAEFIRTERGWLKCVDDAAMAPLKALPAVADLIVSGASAVKQAVELLENGEAAALPAPPEPAADVDESEPGGAAATADARPADDAGATLESTPAAADLAASAAAGAASGDASSQDGEWTPRGAETTPRGQRPSSTRLTPAAVDALSQQAQLLAEKEEFEHRIANLASVLGEAKAEMGSMKAAISDRDERIANLTALLEANSHAGNGMEKPATADAAAAQFAGEAPPGEQEASAEDVGMLREHLHHSRQENEELRAELSDVQRKLAEMESRHKTFLTRAATASGAQMASMADAAKAELRLAKAEDSDASDEEISEMVEQVSPTKSLAPSGVADRLPPVAEAPDGDDSAELKARLEAQEALLTRLTDALNQRNRTIADYEQRLSAVMQQMADAVATGDMRRIGQGVVGPNGARIVTGSGVRSIRGGGVGSSTASPALPPPAQSTDSFIGRIMRRISGSPATPDRASLGGDGPAHAAPPSPLIAFLGAPQPTGPPPGARAPPPIPTTPVPPPPGVSASATDMLAIAIKACEAGDVGQVAALLDAKFNANQEDKVGRTPLLHASRNGHLELCELLAEHGADLGACDKDGRNALHYAARRGHVAVVRWLLERNISVSQTDVHALTPLHQAALGKSPSVVEMLLRAGADIEARDANGCTVLKLAKRFEKPDDIESVAVVEVLERWIRGHSPSNGAVNQAGGPVGPGTA